METATQLSRTERQVAPTIEGIRRDHVARYEFAREWIAPGEGVLDVACGVGYGAQVLAKHGCHVNAYDRSLEALQYGRAHYDHPGIRWYCRDLNSVNDLFFAQAHVAVCFETIEHLEDPLPMLKALHAAAPRLLASVPNEDAFPHNGRVLHHYRHYTRAQFEALLREAGYYVVHWFGQMGPESDVAEGPHGRTLVAVAERLRSVVFRDLAERTSAAAQHSRLFNLAGEGDRSGQEQVPEHVAIVGLGPTRRAFFDQVCAMGGSSAWCNEVWGINVVGDVLKCDRIFHMDDVRIQELRAEANPGGNIAAMVRWLKHHPGPIYTSVVREGYPGMVAFPLEAVLNGRDGKNGGVPYFTSTAAYAIAYAVHLGVKKISLYGLDYTMPNSHEAEKGRACCEFWLGIASARGIEVVLPSDTSMLGACEGDAGRLYGYDCVDVTLHDGDDGRVSVRFEDKAEIPTAEEIEARYSRKNHVNPMVGK